MISTCRNLHRRPSVLILIFYVSTDIHSTLPMPPTQPKLLMPGTSGQSCRWAWAGHYTAHAESVSSAGPPRCGPSEDALRPCYEYFCGCLCDWRVQYGTKRSPALHRLCSRSRQYLVGDHSIITGRGVDIFLLYMYCSDGTRGSACRRGHRDYDG